MTFELIEKLNQCTNPEEKIKIADQVLEEIQFALEAYFEKGYALYELERYDEALDILNKIDWMKEDEKDLLYGFVEYLRNRKK